MTRIYIQPGYVLLKLQRLRTGKAPGPDGIHPRMLKELAEQLSTPMATIFQHSLNESQVPASWRTANVVPLFKKGSKKDAANYRPISLTSLVGKVMESIIRDHIMTHIQTHKPARIPPGKVVPVELVEFIETVRDEVDNHNNMDIAYLDFANAFDKVPHERLLLKIKSMGIHEQVTLWIAAWLRDRQQRVVVNGEMSERTTVTSGVPQGSILGPLLFLIYINDLDTDMQSKVLKFADDTKLCHRANGDEDNRVLQKDLDLATNWTKRWQMEFNVKKCKIMHIGPTNQQAVYTMGNHKLDKVEEEKDLGVNILSSLSVSHSCAKAASKGQQMAGFIYRTVSYKSIETVVLLYKALVRPHLEYCAQVWAPYLRKDIDALERVQRRVTKMIKCISTCRMKSAKKIGLIKLENRRRRGDLIEVFKIVKGLVNVAPDTFFHMSNRQSRGHRFKLEKPRARLEIRKHCFSHRVVDVWNCLPAHVVETVTVNQFKAAIQRLPRGAFKSWRQLPAPQGHLAN